MGRTEPTYRHVLDRMETDWRDFRRALGRTEEQAAFDALFQKVRAHASACTNAARTNPLEAALMSVLVEHELELKRLRATVARLEAHAAGVSA